MTKTVTNALASSIAKTTTNLSTCFKLTLRSGVLNSSNASVLTFTDHDEDIVFSTVTYKTIGGYTRSAVDTTGEMKTDQLELAGLILSSTITEKDLRDGVYDYSRIEMFMLDWNNPNQGRLWLRGGWLGEVTSDDNQYKAELRGMAYLLQQVGGEKYSQTCRYIVGDTKCTASVAVVTCAVASVINSGAFEATGSVTTSALASVELSTTASRYAGNVVSWFTGSNKGRSMEVQTYDGAGQFKLYLKMPSTIQVGDIFTTKAGCDKTTSNLLGCASFDSASSGITNNVINFGGEPHIRGDASFMYAKPGPADSIQQSTTATPPPTTPAPAGNPTSGNTSSVSSAAASDPSVPDPANPPFTGFPQKWYGNPFAGPFTSLGNTTVKGSRLVAQPFRANYTGNIASIRWYNIYVLSGYAAGNGGSIRVRLVSCRSDGRPNMSNVLGTSASLGTADSIGTFPLQTFASPVAVVAGTRYALVYDNVAASPGSNYTSVDDQNTNWHTTTDPYAPTPITPVINDYDWRTIYSDNGGSSWTIRPRTPIVQINYSGGNAQGSGYENAGGAHSDDYRVAGVNGPIDGTHWVRQIFTPDRSFTGTHFGICVGITPSAGSANLLIRIKRGTTLLSSIAFTEAEINRSALFPYGNSGGNKDRRWHEKALPSNISFVSGTQYIWEASGTNGTQYTTCASHRGGSFTSGGGVTVGGTAQYSSNGGSSWNNWIHQGNVSSSMDLQFFLRTT